MSDSPYVDTPSILLTHEQRELLYSLHRNLKGSFLQFDKLCRELNIVTSTKG